MNQNNEVVMVAYMTPSVDFVAAGASVVQLIESGRERWICRHPDGATMRDAIDNAIRT